MRSATSRATAWRAILGADRRQRLKRRRLLWDHSASAETGQSSAQLFEGRDRLGKAAGSGLRGQARRRRQPRIREHGDQHRVGEFGRTKRRLCAPTARFNADAIDRKKIELLTHLLPSVGGTRGVSLVLP